MTSNIHALLNKLRDNPADNSAASENVLQQIYDHLMSAKQDSTGRVHWFCSQASDTVVASAGFLLRLYGFNGPSVDTWQTNFRNCVSNCCDCAQQLEEVKVSSRATYVQEVQSVLPKSNIMTDILELILQKYCQDFSRSLKNGSCKWLSRI